MRVLILIFLMFSANIMNGQSVSGEYIDYKDGNTQLEGYLAFDPSVKDKRPLILVVHEWRGINEYTRKRCDELAALGYVAFAPDIYGKGVRPSTNEEAGKEAGKYKIDRKLMRQRMQAGLNAAKKFVIADSTRIAVIGYCFGGTAALELGRSGAEVDGIISFHGGLSNPHPADAKNIKAKVLICHGAIDPSVPEKEVLAFQKEMNDAGVDYQFISYSNAVHAFTNPSAGNDISKGAAYNRAADIRSWNHLMVFLKELFGQDLTGKHIKQ